MKKIIGFILCCLLSGFPMVWAETVSGILKSVDENTKKFEIQTNKGNVSLAYNLSTRWPSDVHSPRELLGKEINVEWDELLEKAQSVTRS